MSRAGGLLTALGLLLAAATASAAAPGLPIDPGLYAMVDEAGDLTGKVMRISRTATDWKFEDRAPDGTWVDITCKGGCQHVEATPPQIAELFGSAPPEGLTVRCVANGAYAFCHAVRDGNHSYSLVLRVPDSPTGSVVVAMIRAPDSGDSPPAAPDDEFF